MTAQDPESLRQENLEIFKKEETMAFSILKRNRHRSCEPREWFGPLPETEPAGPTCFCEGCKAYYALETSRRLAKPATPEDFEREDKTDA